MSFSLWAFFSDKTIIVKPLAAGKHGDQKNEILVWRKTLLKKVKSYTDNHLNSAKVNITDSKKEYFAQPLSIPENLAELQTRDDDYYRTLYIKGWWFWATSETEAKFLFCKQIFQWWIENRTSIYGHPTCFQSVKSNGTNVLILLKKGGAVPWKKQLRRLLRTIWIITKH